MEWRPELGRENTKGVTKRKKKRWIVGTRPRVIVNCTDWDELVQDRGIWRASTMAAKTIAESRSRDDVDDDVVAIFSTLDSFSPSTIIGRR